MMSGKEAAMKILCQDDYQTMPWKNGGGVTHEVAYSPSRDDFAWRLSVAEVAISGPFSKFEGMRRVLTVIKGVGLNLVSNSGTQSAMHQVPTSFCGSTELYGQLLDGPIRDFNLIFDPKRVEASVNILSGTGLIDLSAANTTAIYAVTGDFDLGGLRAVAGNTIFGSSTAPLTEFNTSGWAIAVQLT
ncbi:MAG: environmental stress-induced protein Ves [Gammaproteobacteria bacterium]|jgi:environmental stress-induced protein Ves